MQTEAFWNDRYRQGSPLSSGRPGLAFSLFAGPLQPGRALELGCGKGDDAVWLARQGWDVTAVDVSTVALELAGRNADKAGMAGRVRFEAHDLAQSFPAGAFDLVVASFLQSPQEWPRAETLARAATSVTRGGHFLVIEHGSRGSWSAASEDQRFATADETFAALRLAPRAWRIRGLCPIARMAEWPDGTSATLVDNVIFLQRRI
ncbi:class I SAM-dependent methyltransferase [Aureimonas sp. SK2]|uniref:SAM-dependent methyltransferase n=1 Tax=Aureimonas sp. SK2 TaxID=3015992 RepID=UPI002443EB2F|nr:class I SAM-dependent methyltransferase [Aureimonas sp. SK2]